MEPGFEERYHELEGGHWWFISRRQAILSLMDNQPRDSKILEAGCSGGLLLKALSEKGFSDVKGIDISRKAVALCRERGLDAHLADAADTGMGESSFDIIVASDVLEHIKDEQKALSEWKRLLKPGGMLIVFVPAFNFLWSSHDSANRHFRRYSGPQLLSALSAAGFSSVRSSYWNFFLFFPAALYRLLFARFLRPKHDLSLPPGPVNLLLSWLLSFENHLLAFLDLPVGVSLFAIAKK